MFGLQSLASLHLNLTVALVFVPALLASEAFALDTSAADASAVSTSSILALGSPCADPCRALEFSDVCLHRFHLLRESNIVHHRSNDAKTETL